MRPTARLPRVLALICLTSFVVGLAPAIAETPEGEDKERRLVSDRLNFTFGGYMPEFSTNVAAGFGGVLGAFIDVEQTLGLDEDLSVFRLAGFYRFKPKHAIDWTVSVMNRDGAALIDEEIEFGDPPRVFNLGAEVASKFDTALFAVNYRYSFVNDGRVDAGITAGLFTYKYDFRLEGEASIVGEDGSDTTIESADTRILAPLPALGMYIHYAFRHNLVFRGEVRFLNLDIGDFSGKFTDTLFALDWYFTEHIGLGVGGSRTSIDFIDSGSDPFHVEYNYGGLTAYLTLVY